MAATCWSATAATSSTRPPPAWSATAQRWRTIIAAKSKSTGQAACRWRRRRTSESAGKDEGGQQAQRSPQPAARRPPANFGSATIYLDGANKHTVNEDMAAAMRQLVFQAGFS